MKQPLAPGSLPDDVVVLTCSSHEDRCTGLLNHSESWSPCEVVLFHYDDPNPARERNHSRMEMAFRKIAPRVTVLQFTESDAVTSLRNNMRSLQRAIDQTSAKSVVIDISVFTKRHLLMMLRWLDDCDLWNRLCVVYSEPGDYVVSKYIPLSFGLASLQQIPGFSACPDLSRPVHLMMFLGYEGDRALAVYEQTQPMKTTLVIPHPPYNPSWAGRTEQFNRDLLALVGDDATVRIDALDPDATSRALTNCFGLAKRHDVARVICPLGTKPQTLGIYSYTRKSDDPPAIVYAGPLRHNHSFFSSGIGKSWLLKVADDK